MTLPRLRLRLRSRLGAVVPPTVLLAIGCPADAEIRFERAGPPSGIASAGPSAGAAWGDLDADGSPDLWITSHHGHPPLLYRNRGDGRFDDVSSSAIASWQPADLHGVSWADFDGDGDQDLLGLSGGGAGRGESPNQLFVNQGGWFREEAARRGLAYPLGRGRTPLWLDADGDGLLDVLVSNYPRPGGRAPSAIFRQREGAFARRNDDFGFRSGPKSRLDGWFDLAWNVAAGRLAWPGRIAAGDFAQLADLSNDGRPELIAWSRATRIFSTAETPFGEVTTRFAWPDVDRVRDAAVADLDGDGDQDLVLVRSRAPTSQLLQSAPDELTGLLVKGPAAAGPRGARFRSDGDIRLEVHPTWRDPTDSRPAPPVYVGKRRAGTGATVVSATAAEAAQATPPTKAAPDDEPRLVLGHDAETGHWWLTNSIPRVTFIARATGPIEDVEPIGFRSSGGEERDLLLLRQTDAFEARPLDASDSGTSACHSVAAADFDNDADVDLYLVCSGPLENRDNRLYENLGDGRFRRVPAAGGASGGRAGRGDVVAVADYDRDGYLDLFVANGAGPPPFANGPNELFRNLGGGNHWLQIDLVGRRSNVEGIGAVVEVTAGGRTRSRVQGGGMHSFAQDHSRLHFGLGQTPRVDRIVVRWPSGTVQTLSDVAVDRILRVEEP